MAVDEFYRMVKQLVLGGGPYKMILCISHQFKDRMFQGKDIRRLGDPGQVFAGRGGIFTLDEHPAADVIHLGADIFGIRGVDKIGLKLIEDLMQNPAGVLKQPVVQVVLKMEQIQGVFRGQVIVRVLWRVGEEGNIFFIIKMVW